tara:strand:+ start:1534 stop:2142 length:609 start_codon:yes stop_codon:yes gene_type:complete
MGLLGSMVAGAAIAHGNQRNQEVTETRAMERTIFAQQATNDYNERMADRKAAAGVAAGDVAHQRKMEVESMKAETAAGAAQQSQAATAANNKYSVDARSESAKERNAIMKAKGSGGSASGDMTINQKQSMLNNALKTTKAQLVDVTGYNGEPKPGMKDKFDSLTAKFNLLNQEYDSIMSNTFPEMKDTGTPSKTMNLSGINL